MRSVASSLALAIAAALSPLTATAAEPLPWYVGAGAGASFYDLDTGDYKNLGNNQMHAFDPQTGIGKHFLVGPKNCEATGVVVARPSNDVRQHAASG